jgi:phage FluMu gp28-like protein
VNAPASKHQLPERLAEQGDLPSVLIPYQARLLEATAAHQFVVCEKSRRIGMTWGIGSDAVLTAGAQKSAGGMDVLYIGFNLDMAQEFIDVCAMWAKAFMPAAGAVEEFLFKEQTEDGAEKSINAFKIRFASGFDIVALTSKPRSLRGRQGFVIFDEAAFHDELDEMLKAAMALLMLDGKVLVISTHDGADNSFNRLIGDIRSGKRKGFVLRVTFDDAINDGWYEHMGLVLGWPQTSAAKAAKIADTMAFYGEDAEEELYCIPKKGSGAYISAAAVEACMTDAHHVARLSAPQGFELRPADERTAYVQAFLDSEVAPHLDRLDDERLTAFGEDFGRSSDLTILAIGQEQRDLSVVVPLMVELKNMPIEQQFQVISFIISRLSRFLGAKFDATGNGLGLAERCQEAFGFERIEAVKLSQGYYLENGPRVKKHFEDQTISLANDVDVRDDMRVVKLVRGIPTIPDARNKGRHGDAFVALMLLLAALKTEYQVHTYARVPRGGRKTDEGRRVSTTAGFGAREGLW